MKELIFILFIIFFISGCSNNNKESNKDSSNNQTKTSENSSDVITLDDVTKKYSQAGNYASSGLEKADLNDYKGAIIDFKKSLSYISNEKDKAIVYFSIGFCYNKLFEVNDAIYYLEKAINSFPNHPKIKEWRKLLNSLKNF